MTCEHCCGADKLFDKKTAEKEKKKYLKKGIRGVTKKLFEQLSHYPINGKSLLDIGGGIGALQWEFISKGGSKTTDVDASAHYAAMAKKIAEEKGYGDLVTFKVGDVTDLVNELTPHDFVTLDKVVCCYPFYRDLLTVATDNCHEILSLTMPYSNSIAKILSKFGNFWLRITGNTFQSYVHPKEDVENFIISKGYTLTFSEKKFPWHVLTFQRMTGS